MTFEAESGSGFDADLEAPSCGSVFVSLWESLLARAGLGADAALSLIRHVSLELHEFIRALSRSSRGAEMRTEVSPRLLVFSSDCPQRNAVSMATFRHSVMTGVCVRLRVRVHVHAHTHAELYVVMFARPSTCLICLSCHR